MDDIEKPLLDPGNFNRDAVDLVSCTKWEVIRTKNHLSCLSAQILEGYFICRNEYRWKKFLSS